MIFHFYELSAALWVHVAAFETTLREFVSVTLEECLNRQDWWNARTFFSKREINYLKNCRSTFLSKRKLSSSLKFYEIPSLSFWLALISKKYGHRVWRNFEVAVPELKAYGRRNFQQKAIVIRDLRNAIAHHAPILHRNLARDLAYMHELTELLSPNLAQALKERSRAEELVKRRKINTPGAKFLTTHPGDPK
jgi:hypothetical protein